MCSKCRYHPPPSPPGRRHGEILKLQRREMDEVVLEIVDSKTGSRTVLFNPNAKAVIERQPRPGSAWVFS